MNIFERFTLKTLLKNRSRTIVTIIGIILSTSMVTAVIQTANSGLEYLRRSEIEQAGAFHGKFSHVSEEDLRILEQSGLVDTMTAWQEVGWAEIGSQNDSKPYLLIESVPEDFTDFVTVKLTSGRMPENEKEILIPDHLYSNGQVKYSLGTELTLSVGKRMTEGAEYALTEKTPYYESEEMLTDCVTHEYTVVGTYQRFPNFVEDYSCPGYIALTRGESAGAKSLFVIMKHPRTFYADIDSGALSQIQANCSFHRDLVRLSGGFRNGAITAMFYGFAAILVVLIGFGSVMLIYNSFSISVSERTRQFGILKSVGATRKQIRHTVLFEGMLLCVVGIPIGIIAGCVGIGVTLWCLRDYFTFLMDTNVQMKLIISPLGLLLAVVLSVFITLISAWIPARRAIKISAIDSIRQTDDVKLKRRTVSTSPLTRKLFGFEGTMASKNFKRNRKRYRATIISLFLSIVLFVSASAFSGYLTDAVTGVTSSRSNADLWYYTAGEKENKPDTDLVMRLIQESDGVKKVSCLEEKWALYRVETSSVSKKYLELNSNSAESDAAFTELGLSIVFLDDESFRTFCSENHLIADKFMDTEHPQAMLYNTMYECISDPNGRTKWYETEVINTNAIPCVLNQIAITEDNGEQLTNLTIGAIVQNVPDGMPAESALLIYPQSCQEAVCPGEEFYVTDFMIRAEEHEKAYEAIKRNLCDNRLPEHRLSDLAAEEESERMLITVIKVFSYGFVTLISLIAIANIFNTISTNVALRRREFAMLKSVGLTGSGLKKMMNYECMIYGLKSLLYGLPVSFAMTYLIWRTTADAVIMNFKLPWGSICVAVLSVFAVIFITMLYSRNKLKKDNTIDALKNENL